jgi:hypothetical protein
MQPGCAGNRRRDIVGSDCEHARIRTMTLAGAEPENQSSIPALPDVAIAMESPMRNPDFQPRI